jgi:hypothetical protein
LFAWNMLVCLRDGLVGSASLVLVLSLIGTLGNMLGYHIVFQAGGL